MVFFSGYMAFSSGHFVVFSIQFQQWVYIFFLWLQRYSGGAFLMVSVYYIMSFSARCNCYGCRASAMGSLLC